MRHLRYGLTFQLVTTLAGVWAQAQTLVENTGATSLFPTVGDTSPASFSFDSVRSLARERAAKPYVAQPVAKAAGFWATLPKLQLLAISPTPAARLWAGEEKHFELSPLFPGQTPLQLHIIKEGVAEDLSWMPEKFDLTGLTIPADAGAAVGFGGIRVYTPLETPQQMDAWWQFSNTEGEHGMPPGAEWGLSAKPIALLRGPEKIPDFPPFTQMWVEQPTADARVFVVYGLIDVPELAAALKYRVHVGRDTTVDVECDVSVRVADAAVAFAAGSAHFSHGENTAASAPPSDFRPEAHQADGMLIQNLENEALWRPLMASANVNRTRYEVEKIWGYGLQQRDRNFDHYQDLATTWQKKPSWFVEPAGTWGAGRILLYEAPVMEPNGSNIHVCWQPRDPLLVGKPYSLVWRGHWVESIAIPRLATVLATRVAVLPGNPGRATATERLYAVDFGPNVSLSGNIDQVVCYVEVDTRGKLISRKVIPNPNTTGWRVEIQVGYTADVDLSEIGCHLLLKGKPISEKWSYLWKK